MNKAIITISQNGDSFEPDVETLVNDKECFIACEAHVLATIIVRHLQQGIFNNKLALQIKKTLMDMMTKTDV